MSYPDNCSRMSSEELRSSRGLIGGLAFFAEVAW